MPAFVPRPSAAASAAFAAFLAALAGGLSGGAPHAPAGNPHAGLVPVLMYHHVGDWGPSNPGWSDWVVRPEEFRRQLDWLAAHGYRTTTFAALERDRARGVPPDPHAVVISFDDGWEEQYHWLRTELEPRGMRAVLFVFTGAVAPNRNGGGYISWEELRELEATGHEVQSHTVSHARLAGMRPDLLERELRESRRVIEERTGHPACALAYPYGSLDPAAAAAARRVGYSIALRADADPKIAPATPWTFPRIRVGYDDPIEVFAERMESKTGPAGR